MRPEEVREGEKSLKKVKEGQIRSENARGGQNIR
jgi:hypothetical protein